MLAVLATLRDLLVALALAWVGVTLEAKPQIEEPCASASCRSEEAR
jgi:hypothetical protein